MKYMKKIFWLLALAASAALGSCTLDQGGDIINNGGNGESIKLKLNVGALSANVTRSTAATEEEKAVHTLTLLFFTPSSDGSGEYVDYSTLDNPVIGGYANQITFRSGSPLRASLPYNILAVANVDRGGYLSHTYNPTAGSPAEVPYGSIGDWCAGFEGMTEAQVIAAAAVGIAGNADESDRVADEAVRIKSDEILMGTTAAKTAEQEIVEMTLTRAVSRFDVVNNASGYDVVSASIWNGNRYSRIWGENVLVVEPAVARFYGVDAEADPGPNGGYLDIMNTLYSFENFVFGPRDTDAKTTCLIIGVQEEGTGAVTYHRINIAPQDQISQSLRRNMVYQVTVRGVKGNGAATESGAYTGGNNELNYIINYWDLDDEEGIIRFDGKNVLAVPVSRIQFLSDAAQREYSIFTFGDGVLGMSVLNMSEGITASLTGNTLKVSVTALPEGVERNGTLKFTFAGLEATVDINQTEKLDTYLELSTHSLPAFPDAANAGLNDDANAIKVNASGTWTAELRNNETDPSVYKFSFRQDSYLGAIDSSDPAFAGLIVNNTVKVYTSSANADDDPREAFVLFRLNSDPTIAQAAILIQRGVSDITVMPNIAEMRFAASGGALTANTLTVRTDLFGGYYTEWNATVENTSNGDDSWFKAVYNYDPTVSGNNRVTVTAPQPNFTGADITATLRLRISGTATYIDIPVVQETYSLTLSPATTTSFVAVAGGTSEEVAVVIPTGATWSATILDNRTTGSQNLAAGHQGYLVDGSGNPVTSLSGMQGTQKLKVSFPKLLTPNVNLTPEIEVRVFITGTNIEKTITFRQSPLVPRQVLTQSYSYSYFSFGISTTGASTTPDVYSRSVWYNMVNTANFSNNGSALLYIAGTPSRPTGYFSDTNLASGLTLLNINRTGNTLGLADNNTSKWNEANTWWQAADGNTMIIGTDSGVPAFLTSRGYTRGTNGAGDVEAQHQINNNETDRATRLMQYILRDGPATQGTSLTEFEINDIQLRINSTRTEMSGWPDTAVAILKYRQANATALIDLENQLIVFTEVDAFYGYFTGAAVYPPPIYGGPHYDKFLTNLVAVMLNMTQYGTHWTDHLTGKATGGYAALAPESIDYK